ncbi:hypothetical protein AVEN_244030-1 [Araneus ventricosus]|uniref:Uncharacterized protein n=1 Tax=Araneus ventricosus TaxID=182803 RepID=A0A4Y2RKS9_ARAVE|nr:hypothetical protein AVEN_244030-1 [Araneus ventricosus]
MVLPRFREHQDMRCFPDGGEVVAEETFVKDFSDEDLVMDNSAIRVPSARAPNPMFGVEVTNCNAFTVRVENVVKFQSRDGAMRRSIDA